jgi:hypothetical protein
VRPHPPIRAALALALAVAAPAGAASGHTQVELLWLQPPAASSGAGPAATPAMPALLSLPTGWMTGDAAVVLIDDPAWPPAARERVVATLLDEQGAAVLVIGPRPALSFTQAAAAATPPGPQALLSAALLALRRDAGAGVVVALGYGAGGEAALRAADEAAAAARRRRRSARRRGRGAWPRGRPGFAAGATPPAREAWPVRAPLLCAALAGAVGGAAPDAALARDCARTIGSAAPGGGGGRR